VSLPLRLLLPLKLVYIFKKTETHHQLVCVSICYIKPTEAPQALPFSQLRFSHNNIQSKHKAMPGLAMDAPNEYSEVDEPNGDYAPQKESYSQQGSPRSPLSPQSPQSPQSGSIGLAMDGGIDTSIEQLYHNVCEMQSSDQSPSRASFGSFGAESRIDSELNHLVGYVHEHLEIRKEVVIETKEAGTGSDSTPEKAIVSAAKKSPTTRVKTPSAKSSPKSKSPHDKPPLDKRYEKNPKKSNAVFSKNKQRSFALHGVRFQNGVGDPLEAGMDNPDLGPFLLKQARDLIGSGENPQKALELALRAVKSFEKCTKEKPSLELVMCLHVLAAIYCSLGQYNEAIPVLERAIDIPAIEDGQDHALAKFAGCMQLGMEIQRQVLGETDPRLGETCRYVAEAHVQALQFDEAEKLCQMALEIHRENGSPASLEEAADRRLMGLICDSKGDYEAALEHYVLAGMSMSANDQEVDAASIDCSIGDAYLSLARYDEAVFSYQKALTVFKTTKGESHPAVASVYVRLADLYNKIGKFKESKSYCENAHRIYGKPNPGTPQKRLPVQALKLLKKALKIFGDGPGHQSTTAGIEAQMGVMYYMMGNYSDSYDTFKSSISKFRATGEKKSALFGIALNQMGLVCVQRYSINEAADLFEEARNILEKEYGPYHPDTLGVYSNLAGTYDAMGRLDDAIEILEYVVGMREEKLGTANPDVADEKRRLAELLKEAGRVRSRKPRSLETLLDTANSRIIENDIIESN
ncbi:Tetratricopeptide repeat-like superfamily protein, partial [Prunus dulcis]